MKITNIVKKKNNYIVTYSDKDYTITEDVVIQFLLTINKELSEFEFQSILEVNDYYLVLNKLISKLIKKQYTVKEVTDYLYKENIFDTKKYIETLTELKLLNDVNYAKQFFYEAVTYKKIGVYKIEQLLIHKGIKKSDLEFIFNDYTFDKAIENLEKLIDSELRQNIKVPKRMFINKLKVKLFNNGFKESEIEEALHLKSDKITSLIDDSIIIEKDFEKHKKLDDFKLKKKLFSLGYDTLDINTIINERKGE